MGWLFSFGGAMGRSTQVERPSLPNIGNRPPDNVSRYPAIIEPNGLYYCDWDFVTEGVQYGNLEPAGWFRELRNGQEVLIITYRLIE